ncbi:hypothetical protein [Desulfofustis limnaeus]|uniref:hypothetical protein n=1 Tax=Desulfofustis limnaeus TaxID=2740163 RepID=UPI0024DF9A9F|nr:hypothetical protein [Desulfofustis limnaeus]
MSYHSWRGVFWHASSGTGQTNRAIIDYFYEGSTQNEAATGTGGRHRGHQIAAPLFIRPMRRTIGDDFLTILIMSVKRLLDHLNSTLGKTDHHRRSHLKYLATPRTSDLFFIELGLRGTPKPAVRTNQFHRQPPVTLSGNSIAANGSMRYICQDAPLLNGRIAKYNSFSP